MSAAKPIGHPDLPVMTIADEVERAGVHVVVDDLPPRPVSIPYRQSATHLLLTQQQGTNHRTGADWPK